MSPQPTDMAIVERLVQQIPGFPASRKRRARYITYSPQGWVQRLDLSRRRLTQVPAELGQLSQLKQLDLSGNQLTQAPAELVQLSQLRWLGLCINQLTQVPAAFGQLPRLRQLDLSNNPELQSPPPAVIAQGTQAILAYLRTLQEQK